MRRILYPTPQADWRSMEYYTLQSGDTGWLNGDMRRIQDTICYVYNIEKAEGAALTTGDWVVPFYHAEKIELPKSTGTGLAITAGDYLYWNTTTRVVSNTNGGTDICIGICVADATEDDTYVKADFDGAKYQAIP